METGIDFATIITKVFSFLAVILLAMEVIFAWVIVKQVHLLTDLLGTELSPYLKVFAYVFFFVSLGVFIYSVILLFM